MKRRLGDFEGESRRSYQKAFSSFQYYLIGNYPMDDNLNKSMIQNWVVDNRIQGLTVNTTSFYLDKVTSLYGGITDKLQGGKQSFFKEIKADLRKNEYPDNYSKIIDNCVAQLYAFSQSESCESGLTIFLKEHKEDISAANESIKLNWASLALRCGILPEVVASLVTPIPSHLNILNLCSKRECDEKLKKNVFKTVADAAKGDTRQWFAMRLKPGIRFDNLLERFSKLHGLAKMPELFYPSEEIAVRTGKKITWKGRPIIKDIVFFRYKITEIYSLFHYLYDLAWCYRNPGPGANKYTVIPDRSMEEFKKAIGILGPGYEIAPTGELELNPGDEVVIISGDFADRHAKVLKEQSNTLDEYNKVYRLLLLDSNGRWEVGIDARLLKKM